MSFYDWCLATYDGAKSAEGAFVAYLKADDSFPRAVTSRVIVYRYLKKSGASVPILETFKRCWAIWKEPNIT